MYFFFPFSKPHKGLSLLPDPLAVRAKEIVVRWTLVVLLASMMFGFAAGMAGTRWWLLDGTVTVISNNLVMRVAKGG
jgi:hypothetical protein